MIPDEQILPAQESFVGNYNRYVVLLALPNRACIVAVNLGAATIRAWIDQSGLRARVHSPNHLTIFHTASP